MARWISTVHCTASTTIPNSKSAPSPIGLTMPADVVGYSRLMCEGESGTLARLKAHRLELIDPAIAARGGGKDGRKFALQGQGSTALQWLAQRPGKLTRPRPARPRCRSRGNV